jgi:ABC-type uncharacterized transport system auxiliary subunit
MRKIFLLLMLLSACAPLQAKENPETIYRLRPPSPSRDCAASSPVVTVLAPEVPAGFDGDRIAVYLDGGRRVDYAASARWAAGFDEMIHDFMLSALRGCPGLAAQEPRFDTPGAYQLSVKINDFQPVYKGAAQDAPDLRVSATFTLTRLPEGTPATSFTLKQNRPAAENSLRIITAGLEGLLRDIMSTARGRLAAAARESREP